MPWFSKRSSCPGPKMSLGTDRFRDHSSIFYLTEAEGLDTGWDAPNRIRMDQLRTDPGEIASFTFWSRTPSKPDVYKQYLTPVLEGIGWLDHASFSYELMFGETYENPPDLRYLLYASKLLGEKIRLLFIIGFQNNLNKKLGADGKCQTIPRRRKSIQFQIS